MKQAGFKYYYDIQNVFYRETRATLSKLFKQKYHNGYRIGRMLGVESRYFSLYHFVPFAYVLAIIVTVILVSCEITWPATALWSAYGLANIVMTVMAVVGSKDRNISFICLPILFLLLHVWYGIGKIVGIEKMIMLKVSFAKFGRDITDSSVAYIIFRAYKPRIGRYAA